LTHGEICPDPEGGTYSNGAYDPAWSPDGRRLAFTQLLPACGETPQVFLADADGTNATQLTHLAGGAEQAAWSPDGTELAFTGFTTHGPEVFAIGADGSNPRDLTSATTGGQNAGDPAWSPDGTKIAFRSNPYVYVMDADGSNPINVTSPTESTCYVNSDPNWSPDGQKLVLVRRELVACDQTGTRRGDIWVMNADGTNRVDVTNTPFPDDEQTPAWSPDGAKIVAFNPYPSADLFVMSGDGSNRTTIGGDNYPDWQPIPQSYARPKGATPFTTYLVPAFKQCASPNRTHGAPL